MLPGSGWLCARAGRAERSGDRRGPDRPGATMGRGSAAGRDASWRRLPRPPPRRHEAPGQRLDTVPRRDHRLWPGTVSSAAKSPAGSAFSGRTTPDARPPSRRTAMTPVMSPSPSCAGNMSSPQKRPSTRHYLQTTQITRLICSLRGGDRLAAVAAQIAIFWRPEVWSTRYCDLAPDTEPGGLRAGEASGTMLR